jgi:hypothetical protein
LMAMAVWTGMGHIHTHYSYDGTWTPRELADMAAARGWQFVLVTEHSNDLTAEAFAALEAECQGLCRDGFVMFPSIEYTCDHNLHIIGYGAGYIEGFPTDSVKLVHSVLARGGLAILAHPRKYTKRPGVVTDALLDAVSGIEVWNSKLAYDGPWVPPLRNYDLLRPGKLAFCGQDAHVGKHLSRLVFQIEAETLTRDALLVSLAAGRYRISNGAFSIGPHASPTGAPGMLGRAADFVFMTGLKQALRVRNLIKGTADPRRRKVGNTWVDE